MNFSEAVEQGQCMAILMPNDAPALVIDANVTIAVAAREAGRDALATAEMRRYSSLGYEWFAPGIILGETLYILCQKHQAGFLTAVEYEDAVAEFEILMQSILPPPLGEASLVLSAQAVGAGYGCSRSADGIYIALAQQLAQNRLTVLITFDKALSHQASLQTPGVNVCLL